MGPPYGLASTTVNGNVQGEKQWQGWAQDLVDYADHQTDMANTRLPYASTGGKGTSVAAARAGSRNRGRGQANMMNWNWQYTNTSGKGMKKKEGKPKKPGAGKDKKKTVEDLKAKRKENLDLKRQQKEVQEALAEVQEKSEKEGGIYAREYKYNTNFTEKVKILNRLTNTDFSDKNQGTQLKKLNQLKSAVQGIAMEFSDLGIQPGQKFLTKLKKFKEERMNQEDVQEQHFGNPIAAVKGAAPEESDDVSMEIMATVDRLIQLYEFKLASSFM